MVSYQYTDFGITTILGNTEFYNEICYAEAIYDASTGLYYMGARYYDSEDGRFLSQDTYRGTATDYGTLEGSGSTILDGAASGYESGAIMGAILGAILSLKCFVAGTASEARQKFYSTLTSYLYSLE